MDPKVVNNPLQDGWPAQRDLFAAQMMAALVGAYLNGPKEDLDTTQDDAFEIAHVAYVLADALIAESQKPINSSQEKDGGS